MNHQEFLDMIDTYGSNLQNWPESLRHSATKMLQHDPQMAGLFALENRFERDIEKSLGVSPHNGFEARITAAAFHMPRTEPKETWQNIFNDLRRSFVCQMAHPALMLAGIAVLGLLVGFVLPVSDSAAVLADTALLENLSTAFYGMRTLI